jgi:hypothetical protein
MLQSCKFMHIALLGKAGDCYILSNDAVSEGKPEDKPKGV